MLGTDADVKLTPKQGEQTTSNYDGLDRLRKITYAGGSTISFTYDADDNLKSRTDSLNGTVSYWSYDWLNRLGEEELPNATIDYTYDGVGNLTSFSDGRTTPVSYGYDAADQLASVSEDGGTTSIVFTYDDDGNPATVTYPSGLTVGYVFDTLDRLTSLSASKGSTTLAGYSYSYLDSSGGEFGLRGSMTDTVAGRTTSYSYDSAARLSEAVERDGSNSVTGLWQYAYDASGNRCAANTGSEISGFGCSSTGSGVTAYSYDDANELLAAGSTTFSYNATGALDGRSDGLDPDSNDRDQNSHVVLPDGTAYGLVYDGPGQDMRRIAGDKQGHEIDFVNSSLLGVLSQTVTGTTTYFLPIPGGRVLAEKTGTSEVDYLVDGLGSTVGLADSTGSLVSGFHYSYDPYGNQRTTEPTGYPAPKLGFAGGYRDATGFLKFGARYYDPSTGRWTQPDAIDQPLDQHGWNRYTYVGDDPINFVDPSGMFGIGDITALFEKLSRPITVFGAAAACARAGGIFAEAASVSLNPFVVAATGAVGCGLGAALYLHVHKYPPLS